MRRIFLANGLAPRCAPTCVIRVCRCVLSCVWFATIRELAATLASSIRRGMRLPSGDTKPLGAIR